MVIANVFNLYPIIIRSHGFLPYPKSAWTMAKQWDFERHSKYTKEFPRELLLNYNSFQFAGCMRDKSVPQLF